MNSKAIADGIAGRFTGLTATVGSTTEQLKVGPTASLPNTIGKGPALLVFHPRGTLDLGMSKRRDDHLDYPVRMLRDPLSYPERSDWLYAWYDAMRDKVEENIDLDLPYVAWAKPIAMAAELDVDDFYGAPYDMVELIVRVKIFEVVPGAGV